jgi:hypothetical protein
MRPAYEWRVTHYNPALRDHPAGGFQGDSWTSVSDAGQTFDGTELTQAEYERVEGLHLDAARAFAKASGVTRLTARRLAEDPDASPESRSFAVEDLDLTLRAMLREEDDGYIEGAEGSGFSIHVGYDYYLYIGSSSPCDAAVAATEASGLFVEPFENPYLDAGAE